MATKSLVKIGPAILSFPHLAAPHKFKEDQKANYSCNLIFKGGEGLGDTQKLVDELAAEHPQRANKKFKFPFRDGGEMTDYEGYEEGDIFIALRKDPQYGQPALVGIDGKRLLDASGKPNALAFYAGCLVKAAVRLYNYSNTNIGVGLSLEALQFVGDGEPLGYAPIDGDDVFEAVDDDDLASVL